MPPIDFDDRRERTLPNVLRRQAERRPDTRFVVSDEVTWSYGGVDARADRYAAGLAALGVTAGDTVALFTDSTHEVVPLTFGVNRLNAMWVPTNADYRGEWLRLTLEDGRARVLVVDAALLPRVAEVATDLPFEHVVVRGAVDGDDGLPRRMHVHPLESLLESTARAEEAASRFSDTSAVLWTSGTTGRSKGVMQSHNAWIRAALSGASSSHTTDDDVLYLCLPLYNSAAWVSVVYRALVAGVPFALDRTFSVGAFWDRVRHFGATQTTTIGAMHVFLWQAPERADDLDNPLRCLGATPMPDAILEPFKQRFGIDIIQQGYGQSEVMGLVSRLDDGVTRWNPGSCGKPLADIEVRVLDEDDLEVPVGEVGEICVRPDGPAVIFNGYLHRPDATADALRNCWYHTGDLGRLDEDGQLHFVDRKHDYMRFKGRSVSSFAVESAISRHPAVAGVAAFGVASSTLASESEVMVSVVPHDGTTVDPEDLARFVAETAPRFFVPRYIDIVDALPMTPTGKVQKYVLRDRGVTASTWDRDAKSG